MSNGPSYEYVRDANGFLISKRVIVRQNVRTAHGTIHSSTVGRSYTLHGAPQVNIVGVAAGKADCGSLLSTAAEIVTDAATCPKCRENI
jgi:hypothetical protein